MKKLYFSTFVQGLEKLIDTMRGKEYSVIIIADAMSNDKVEQMCAEYEDRVQRRAAGAGALCSA